MKRILVLDDNLTICLMLKSWLVKKGYDVLTATSVSEAKKLIKDTPFDLILSDIRMPESDGFFFLSWIKKYDSSILVIMMTSFSDVETAVESMKMGAVDYISKPIDPDVFFQKIEDAFRLHENKVQNDFSNKLFIKLPFDTHKELYGQIDSVAESKEPLLILGDRGTGKVSTTQYIYEKGYGHSKPFIQIDEYPSDNKTISYTDELATPHFLNESFEKAKGGILFLRQIENMNHNLQDKLLTLLQKQNKDDNYVRVIASTSDSFSDLKGKLIPKLYQILKENTIQLFPLKDKKQDILFYSDYFLSLANNLFGKDIKEIGPELTKRLTEYEWPGNIQELKNIIIKAALLTDGSIIKTDIIPELFENNKKAEIDNPKEFKMEGLKKENFEKEKISEALEISKGNKTLAAQILNINRKTLYNKIKIYGIDLPN